MTGISVNPLEIACRYCRSQAGKTCTTTTGKPSRPHNQRANDAHFAAGRQQAAQFPEAGACLAPAREMVQDALLGILNDDYVLRYTLGDAQLRALERAFEDCLTLIRADRVPEPVQL